MIPIRQEEIDQENLDRAAEQQAAARTAAYAASDPMLHIRVRQWSIAAPTLPAGALVSLATAGVQPDSDVGHWLINNAVPALLWKPNERSNPQADAANLAMDPARLEQLKNQPLEQTSAGSALAPSADEIGNLQSQSFDMGAASPEASAAPIDPLVTGVRELGAAAQTGLEGLTAIGRIGLASTSKTISNIAHGQAPNAGMSPAGIPYDAQNYKTPTLNVPNPLGLLSHLPGGQGVASNAYGGPTQIGGSDIHYGGAQALTNPGQLTLVQQAQGKSLGTGILPGGPAVAAAQAAQQAAGSVNGHAMTPGRALASYVTAPNSLMFSAVSGLADAYVALNADPALLLTEKLTEAAKLAKTIGPTGDDTINAVAHMLVDRSSADAIPALRDYTLATTDDTPSLTQALAERITNDPVSVRSLINDPRIPAATARDIAAVITGHEMGLVRGLASTVNPDNFLAHLVSPANDNYYETFARNGFTDIGHKTNWSLDANLHLALADATSGDEVRQAMLDHLSTLSKMPTMGLHPIADMRWASIIPTELADVNDANSLLERARQDLQLFKVPRAEWDNYLPNVVRSEGDYDKAFKAFTDIGDRGAQRILSKVPGYKSLIAERDSLMALGDNASEEEAARLKSVRASIAKHSGIAEDLTNYFYAKGNESRIIHNAELGGAHSVEGLMPGADGMTAVTGPFGVTELLNRGIPTPGLIRDPETGLVDIAAGQQVSRAIERAVGTWAPLFNTPVVGDLASGARRILVDGIADTLTNTMKSFAMMHVGTGLRIIGSQGARMAMAGAGELSDNPIGLLGIVGGAGNITIKGDELIPEIGELQNRLAAAVGRATDYKQELGGAAKYVTKGWSTYDTNTPEGLQAWINRLSHTGSDPVGRAVAKALAEGEGLDAVKDSVWEGDLRHIRQQMIDANVTWGQGDESTKAFSRNLSNRGVSDAWVDAWGEIVQSETANDPHLLQQMADGFAENMSPEIQAHMRDLAESGLAPKQVTGAIRLEAGTQENFLRRAMGAVLSATSAKVTHDWQMVPTARRYYWAEIERMLPYLSEDNAAAVRTLAEGEGVTLPEVTKDALHTASLDQVDRIAQAKSRDQFIQTFYNPGRRPILADQLRDIVPFANVIQEHARAFTRLIAQNPKYLRIAQMGVTAAQQSGWWTKDQYGKQQFTMVPGAALAQVFGVEPFDMTGEASRLNVVTQGWPSVGPVVQWGAPPMLDFLSNHVIGDNSAVDSLQRYINPYGRPDFTNGAIETMFPGYLDKFKTSGYFAGVPFLSPSPHEKFLLNEAAAQNFRRLASTGHYDLSDENQLSALWSDALRDAKVQYGLMGLAQFVSPVPPQLNENVIDKGGAVVQQYILAKRYQALLTQYHGDSAQATDAFVNEFGVDNIFSEQPMSRALQYGLPTTVEAKAWANQHPAFTAQYHDIYGYFTPQTGKFDYQQFIDGFSSNAREDLGFTANRDNGQKWYHLAEARIGNAAWDTFRRTLPPSLNRAQQQIADAYKASLVQRYRGFGDESLKLATDTAPNTIAKFAEAAHDPAVANTPLAAAIRDYMTVRDEVIFKQGQMGLSTSGVSTAAAAAGLRNALYAWGSHLETLHPEFANVWQHVLSYEVDNPTAQTVTP